ncbi:class I SAM-dependent methyltransferase [Sphingomonas bacterium]|uniref:class I SAM-dependent methyltransferase n=1 Tax=Sphingomonas bacterium TaxID=1895847 RepID=UPI001576B625|nr:class I SAM-dependent methyltransferase [Sphingomonas bacterium]
MKSNLADDRAALAALTAPWPDLDRLIALILAEWPEHASFLLRSFAPRSPGMMATSEHVARAILALTAGHAAQVASDYRWLCARIQEEELEFARSGHYRYSSFEQTNAHVYSDAEFMGRYMHGLLFSHVLWFMHASSLHFFRQRLEGHVPAGGSVLEVGPGHGLLLYLALSDFRLSRAHGWDLSEVSLAQTRAALDVLGAGDKAHLAIQDMHAIDAGGETFDLVILSHILEHLDDPVAALLRIRGAIPRKGKLFVNVPLNAPMPDHVILLETPEMAARLLTDGGFTIVEMASHTTQAITLGQSLKRRTAVTCSIIAEVA